MRRSTIMTQRRIGILLSILVIACSDSGTEPEPPATGPAGLRITPEDPVLRLGESIVLDVEFVDAGNRPVSGTVGVTWSSNDADVVSVDGDGLLLARAFGSATITASTGSLSASVEARVQTPAAEVGANTLVSAVIDTAGGLITATAADGTRYMLSVPRYALSKATTITLTPLASIGGFPAESGASAAVQFEPDGLTFTRPAELTIIAPAAFAAPTVAFSQSGAGFLLAPAAVRGDTARIMVGHFSRAGTTAPTPEEAAALAASGPDAENTARHGVAQELNRAAAAGEHPDPDVIEQYMKAWFEGGVLPALEGAIAGATDTEAALGEWLRWWGDMQLWADDRLETEIDHARTLALAALRAEIDRLNEHCAADDEPSLVYDILHFAGLAALFGFDDVDPSLSLSAIFVDLCMQIVIDATLADPFVEGSTLEVRAGLSVGGRPAEYDVPLDIQLTSSTVTFTQAGGTTDGSGRFSSDVDLREDAGEVVIHIEAVHPVFAQMRASHSVSASVNYELDLFVDGGIEAAIETEDVAWLSVILRRAEKPLDGETVAIAVVSGGGSVEPGSVRTDATGSAEAIYRAPEEPDTVLVTATYSGGGQALTDTVTIRVNEAPKGRVAVHDIYHAWGVHVMARQAQVPTAEDGRDVWTAGPGPLTGGYSASASAGGASASGSVRHDGSVELGDTSVLLTVRSMGDAEGSVSANAANDQAGATSVGGSDMHVTFEVLDERVYYEITADGVTNGAAGSEAILTRTGSGAVIFQKQWHAYPDSLVTGGWLSPGTYSFDAAGSVMMGAGSNSSDGGTSADGSFAYRVLFRILEDEPKQEEP